jgi:hypothetical protein
MMRDSNEIRLDANQSSNTWNGLHKRRRGGANADMVREAMGIGSAGRGRG